ncbi:MAG TPA: DUF4278 domain-containing protein [Leptolyngbyaceae cyanobacterium]
MSLRYRGVNYEPAQAYIEISEEFIGHYRGAVVTRHNLKQASATKPIEGLKYRGITIK